jgi:hypothetical protein
MVGEPKPAVNIISRFYSGQPYTPENYRRHQVGPECPSRVGDQPARKPNQLTIDLNFFKSLLWAIPLVKFSCGYINLFDALNPIWVFEDSGQADYTIYEQQDNEADPGWFVRPDFYSEPRSVQMGFKWSF